MTPLVSCICVTQNRRHFLRKAIQYYIRAQRYSQIECELIIIDGSKEPNPDFYLDNIEDDDIHYNHFPKPIHTQMGWFHNKACELARGQIIIKWDDDDWQASDRILKQANYIYEAELIALVITSQYYGYHLVDKQAFRSRSWDAPNSGSLGGVFAFHRNVWETVPFPEVDMGEDSYWFDAIQKAKLPILDMCDPSLYVYIRHNQNYSSHSNQNYLPEATLAARSLMGTDIDFYDELSEILPLAQGALPKTFGQHGIYKHNLPRPNVLLENHPCGQCGHPMNASVHNPTYDKPNKHEFKRR